MSLSHYAESSARARSRVQGARSSRIASVCVDPIGELSGFPLIPCPDSGLTRVVEGRTKKDGDNHGRPYFKCATNGVSYVYCPSSIVTVRVITLDFFLKFPKLCGYYRFEKRYFEQLKEKGII